VNDAQTPASKPAMRRVFMVVVYALAVLLARASVPAPAQAQATVTVELRAGGRPAAGTVTLTASAGGRTFSCTAPASNGTCTIQGVPGGMYSVTVAPAQGAAPRPRTAMIPPSGTARLIVAAH
jgi:hypothetical protein